VTDPSPILSDVRSWLEREGYVLEMEVARLLVAAHASVTQGARYTDPETGKDREIDVVAFTQEPEEICQSHNLKFLVECKSTTAPWVFFLDGGHERPAGGVLFGDQYCRKCFSIGSSLGLFREELPMAYAVTEKRSGGGQDHAYQAVQQAASVVFAEFGLTPSWDGHAEPGAASGSLFAVPIVVTRSPLVTCELLPDGSVALTATDTASVLVRRAG